MTTLDGNDFARVHELNVKAFHLTQSGQPVKAFLLVMTTLVATITFAVVSQCQEVYNNFDPHEGRTTLLTKSMFQVFVIANTIAMYNSDFVAASHIWA
ncbi:hypothetical protein ACLB2K_055978 [Fragaria x ananassa]